MYLFSLKLLLLLLAIPQLVFSSISAECNFNTSKHITELSQLKAIKKIEVHVVKHKKWTKNLMKATFGSGPILQKYKKKFDAEINTYYEFGKCHHQAQVRLHGDWKDHIDFVEGGKFAQSLDVSLKSGAIGNFVKFKLLLPKTRYKSNEIIFTHLLRNLGFLAPRTGLVDVEVNGRTYQIACDEGQEDHLRELSKKINDIVLDLVKTMGQAGDSRLILMASLILADENSDYKDRISYMSDLKKNEFSGNTYDKATKRILDVAAKLNK